MRDLPVGNGSLLVNFDDKYQVRDIYFPHIGQEDHTKGFPSRLGVWVAGEFSWIADEGWTRELRYGADNPITDVLLTNAALDLEIRIHDTVAPNDNIFLRYFKIDDLAGGRDIRVFLHHDFRIYETKKGDTAFYDPETHALIHYKRDRYFLINTSPHFGEFATGRKAFKHNEGTWRDAEDGTLSNAAITEGSVDSTIAVHLNGSGEFYCWIAAGRSYAEVCGLDKRVAETGAASLFSASGDAAKQLLARSPADLTELPAAVAEMYRRSLLVVQTQIDSNGAIIAATDHDVTIRATDHYAYLWPRDGAFVANALDRAGDHVKSRNFFDLASRILDHRGYFLQKYNPDGTPGSGWHSSWDHWRQRPLAPIQEDETSLVLWALWEHHRLHPDLEFARRMYETLVTRAADFLVAFRDPNTGLPLPSWNLWEDRRGVHTFTTATVVAGLRAAAELAKLCNDDHRSTIYHQAADDMLTAMAEHLHSPSLGRFIRSLEADADDHLTPDASVDASLFALFYFGCFTADDPRVVGTMQAVEDKLLNRTEYWGVARYENDGYMRASEGYPGNSWFICTLWLAEWYIAIGDLDKALRILEWVPTRALTSGVLAEQFDPLTGQPLSVSPLTWSHSTYLATVHSYLARL
ncbi:MAG TPA: glycoside hydrolase family 15 protein [Pyrinomonadaceae bacterium]|nr:glycoside hydrolase family 15 protein [Pyrinomonadaceae bacterium]